MTTAHHWRDVRQYISEHGVADPMALPSMHRVLDYTEKMAKEAIAAEPDRAKAESELRAFNRRLYPPVAEVAPRRSRDDGEVAATMVPAGFEDPAAVEESNNAFARWAGAAR